MEDLLEPVLAAAAVALGMLAYLTWLLLRALVAPLRFAFSSGYRQRVLSEWQKRRWLPWVQIPLVMLTFAALTFLIPFWVEVFASTRNAPPSDAERWAEKALLERGKQKLREMKKAAQERIHPQP